jgi:hypothetical protein
MVGTTLSCIPQGLHACIHRLLRQLFNVQIGGRKKRQERVTSAGGSSDGGFQGLNIPSNLFRLLVFRHFKVIANLEVHPEDWHSFEISSQAQGGIRRNGSALVDNLSDPRHRYAQIQRQLVHAEPERLHELLAENLARMHGV